MAVEDPPSSFARLLVEHWPIERLKPYERNPRKNDKAVDQIRASISLSVLLVSPIRRLASWGLHSLGDD